MQELKAVDDFCCNVFPSTAFKLLLKLNIFPAVNPAYQNHHNNKDLGREGSISAKAYPPLEHHFLRGVMPCSTSFHIHLISVIMVATFVH